MANTPESIKNGFFNGADDFVNTLIEHGKAIEAAEEKARRAITDIDGRHYYFDEDDGMYVEIIHSIPDDEPHANPYTFFTLDGIIDYIKEDTEGFIPDTTEKPLILHVVDQSSVKLMSRPSKHNKVRHCIAACAAHTPAIIFGTYMDVESFNTQLLSKFIDTPCRAELFKVVKSLTKEQGCNTTDDGVTQVVTVKQGVSMAANVAFQNPVPLAPMRTFAEVEQPESNFTLRVSEEAKCALFEADGGAWKNEAVARIKEYLKHNLYGYNVVVIA